MSGNADWIQKNLHEDLDPHTSPRGLLHRGTMKWNGGNGGGPNGGQGVIL
jgi:hypothetical protein